MRPVSAVSDALSVRGDKKSAMRCRKKVSDALSVRIRAGQGPAGAHVASLSEGARRDLEHRLRRRLLGEGGDRSITLNARAWAVRGVVPVR